MSYTTGGGRRCPICSRYILSLGIASHRAMHARRRERKEKRLNPGEHDIKEFYKDDAALEEKSCPSQNPGWM